jgi:hypothetical protein
MVWGIMSGFGVGPLVRVDERLNGERYSALISSEKDQQFHDAVDLQVDVLLVATGTLEEGGAYFLQDNAPAHRARATRETLAILPWNVFDFPPLSPDLNVVENLWGSCRARRSATDGS